MSDVARTSTSPVANSGLRIASGRATTSPSISTTDSWPSAAAAAHSVGRTVRWIERHLNDPCAVAQVDEGESAEVAGAVHPAAQANELARRCRCAGAAQVGTLGRREMFGGHDEN